MDTSTLKRQIPAQRNLASTQGNKGSELQSPGEGGSRHSQDGLGTALPISSAGRVPSVEDTEDQCSSPSAQLARLMRVGGKIYKTEINQLMNKA